MKLAVVDLASTRRLWSVPDATVAAVRRAFGRGWTVRRVEALASSDGDGATDRADATAAATGAEVYVGWGVPPGVAAAAAPTLRWAHSAAAGVGASITATFRATGATLTNSAGVHAEPVADWVVTAIGFCLRGFHYAVRAQAQRHWAKAAFADGTVAVRELTGTRVGLVGLGGIGRAVARRCAALGMRVAAVRRHPRRARPRSVSWVRGSDQLMALAARSDVLVLTAPHTRDTRRLVTGEVLRALPRGACVVNVSRGELLDEAALLAALEDGHVAACALDVFQQEPLPADAALWAHPHALVFPHASGVSDRFWARETTLLVDNVRRYRAGRRLRNVVNLDLGY